MALFGRVGFTAMVSPSSGRTALRLEPGIASRQSRIGGRPTVDASHLPYFAGALNRWHLPNARRLLWLDHWNNDTPGAHDFFSAVRRGFGEERSLFDAPGHAFEPHPYDEQDQTAISSEQARETGVLIGLASLVMFYGWDGWLVADGSSDAIEFWEGNIFFHSIQKSRLVEASSLLQDFDCPRDLA
jgi:hypothetical protein